MHFKNKSQRKFVLFRKNIRNLNKKFFFSIELCIFIFLITWLIIKTIYRNSQLADFDEKYD